MERSFSILIEPALGILGGEFEQSKDPKLKIWVTADKHKIPVKIESDLTVGSIVFELISCRD